MRLAHSHSIAAVIIGEFDICLSTLDLGRPIVGDLTPMINGHQTTLQFAVWENQALKIRPSQVVFSGSNNEAIALEVSCESKFEILKITTLNGTSPFKSKWLEGHRKTAPIHFTNQASLQKDSTVLFEKVDLYLCTSLDSMNPFKIKGFFYNPNAF